MSRSHSRSRLAVAGLVLLAGCSDAPEILAPSTAPPAAENAAPPAFAAGAPSIFQPGVVVARFTAGAPAAQIAALHGARVVREIGLGMRVLRVEEGRELEVVGALSRNPSVLFAEPSWPRTVGIPCAIGDCTAPSDPLLGRRWDLHNDGTIRSSTGEILESVGPLADADMDWLEAFSQLGAFTGSAYVGVVDTGVYPSHVDLAGRLAAQWDFFNIDGVAEDDNGHGTHVSGMILAYADNGEGAMGVAYGPNIRLAVAKGCGNTILGYLCWSPDVADGIKWLADQGVHVMNISLGGAEPSDAEQLSLQYAQARNVLPVCAAGNDRLAVGYPAAFPECMAVSATDWADHFASYTNVGPEIEVSAPGGDTIHARAYDMIASTWNNGGYVYSAGTSMAAPQVTGLAAMLHALGVTGAAEKRALIRSTADDLGAPGYDQIYGSGRINVWAAVQEAGGSQPPPPPENQPPVSSFTYACTDLSCDFTDASTDADGTIASWSWDFGDGATSSAQSPSHGYAAAGTYTVGLTVTDDDGASGTSSQSVTVSEPPPPPENQPPVSSFTYACTDLSCDFTDASTDADGTIASWSWDFGDGATSSAQSPSHGYAAAGTYTVGLTVTDDDGASGTSSQSVTVSEPPPPPTLLLTIDPFKDRGQHVVDLVWGGATSATVDVYRDGVVIATVANDLPTYRDYTGNRGKATYVYKVCEAGTAVCSNEETAIF